MFSSPGRAAMALQRERNESATRDLRQVVTLSVWVVSRECSWISGQSRWVAWPKTFPIFAFVEPKKS
jgi:hypothetical protein